MLSVFFVKAQNSVSGGFTSLTPGYQFKYMLYGAGAGYNLGMGEKWSTHFGISYYTGSSTESELLGKIDQTAPDFTQTVKRKNSAPDFNIDFKRYVGQGTNETGGFYIKLGLGYMPFTYKVIADSFDEAKYYGTDSRTNKANFIHIKLQFGFDFEIADMLFLYFETGTDVLAGEGQYLPLNIGIKKVFFKL